MALLNSYQLITTMSTTSVSFFDTHNNDISLIGSIASVVGLILSFYVVYTAKRINKFILFSTRLPQLLNKMTDHASAISKLLSDYSETSDDIRNEMMRCSANLKSLRKKVPRTNRKPINELTTLIESNASNKGIKKETARKVYLQLLYIIEDVNNLQIDYQSEK